MKNKLQIACGTHESGLREGLFNAVKSFIDIHALQPKGVKLMPEDVFARASFVLSAKVLDPQFQGQIKNSRRPTLLFCDKNSILYDSKIAIFHL